MRDTESYPNPRVRQIVDDVASLTVIFVNVYMVGSPHGGWVLVDAGIPFSAGRIRRAVQERFGNTPPEAIVLTHGHFDHVGAALELANEWNVPIYAHYLELPYLTGQSDYPPKDPTVGGALAQMARFFPDHGYNFGDRIRQLPADGVTPHLPEWRWIHTPGHTHGHVSLFRERDAFLIAGDALATVNQDSMFAMMVQKPELHTPPAPFTTDWEAARISVERLSELNPRHVAAGHGLPLYGDQLPDQMRHFASVFAKPRRGRYVAQPATANEYGVVSLPPPTPDRVPKVIAGLAIAAAAGATAFALLKPPKPKNKVHTTKPPEAGSGG